MGSVPSRIVWRPRTSFVSWSLGHPLLDLGLFLASFVLVSLIIFYMFKHPRKIPEEFRTR